MNWNIWIFKRLVTYKHHSHRYMLRMTTSVIPWLHLSKGLKSSLNSLSIHRQKIIKDIYRTRLISKLKRPFPIPTQSFHIPLRSSRWTLASKNARCIGKECLHRQWLRTYQTYCWTKQQIGELVHVFTGTVWIYVSAIATEFLNLTSIHTAAVYEHYHSLLFLNTRFSDSWVVSSYVVPGKYYHKESTSQDEPNVVTSGIFIQKE